MKVYRPHTNVFGHVDYYYESEEKPSSAGMWVMYILPLLILFPLILAMSPIFFFVTRSKLKKGCEKKSTMRRIKIINRITLVLSIVQVTFACIIGYVAIGHTFGWLNWF